MPLFEYRGLNRQGKNVKGVVDSENLRAARMRLKKDGIFVVDIKDRKKADNNRKKKVSTRGGVNVKELALMTRQLATLIKANIPLVDALSAVSEQVEHPVLSEAIADCKNIVNEGGQFHKALGKYPNIFNNIYVSMVEAGEASGSLDVILMRLAEFTESSADLRQKVSSALTYPILMLLATLSVLAGLFVFVIPKMVMVFEGNPNLKLPLMTILIIDLSALMVNYWYLLIGAILVSVWFFQNWKKSPTGAPQFDALALKTPYVGPIVRMVAVSRFTRTLATLLNGGVPMLYAMDIVRNVVNNHVVAAAIDDARSNISEGESIAAPLKKSGQFPPIVIHMVSIGEKTGELENMLMQVADAYDFQVKNKLDSVTSLMGPAVTIVMGIVIAVIVFSIMVPIFEMTTSIG